MAGTSWTYNNTANVMSDGAYTVIARVIDLANNVGLTATRVVTVDTAAPTATAAISAITDDNGISATDFITNDQTLTLSATLTGTLGSGESVHISLDNGATWNNATLVSGSTYSYTHPTTLVAGSYNTRARVVDTAGNAVASAATVVTVDTTGPAMTAVALTAISTDTNLDFTLGTANATNTATNTDLLTRDPLLTVSGTYVGTLNAGEFLQISSNVGATWTNVTTFSNTTHTWSYNDPVVRSGAVTYHLRAIDTAGNQASGTGFGVITVDTTAPSITGLIAPVLRAADDSGVVGDNITTANNLLFTSVTQGTVEANSNIYLINDVNRDGKYSEGIDTVLKITTVAADGTWAQVPGTLATGYYHLGFMVVNSIGEDIIDFTLAGNTAVTVNLNTTTAQNTGFNTATLTSIEGVVGAGGNDNLTASTTVNSLLDGRGGNDTYTISGNTHTLLTFTNINNSDATGGNGQDTVIGFGLGNTTSVAAADAIDLSALLHGYTGTAYTYYDSTTSKNVLDKASEGLMDYLSVTNNGTNTSISIDRDSTGDTFAPTLVLTLNNVTTDLETLLVNHQLIV